MNKPRISVIMSVYNSERYLREAFESILNQTFSNFEFIIVDDGSTDKSWEMLKEFKVKDSRIKLIKNENNIGLTKSLNKALRICRGEYIARQDADDISLPNRLEKELSFLEKNREYGILGSAYREKDEEKDTVNKPKVMLCLRDKEIRKNIIKFNPFCHSSVLFRKKIIGTIGYYNEQFKYSQDYELWFRILKYHKGANLEDVLIYRRLFSVNISNKRLRKQIIYAIKAKIFGISSLKLPFYYYLYILGDLIRLILPLWAVQPLEKIKTKYDFYS
ncbi:MAG: glycosyltransferase [Candidatus Omnitrophica bacterium]|nr:glycosyltransferase [Candidatus Omnitrophota bacterium]